MIYFFLKVRQQFAAYSHTLSIGGDFQNKVPFINQRAGIFFKDKKFNRRTLLIFFNTDRFLKLFVLLC